MTPLEGPLKGVRIVDMTTGVIGPSATQALAELGADVTKIEPPGGDGQRSAGPSRHPGMGSQFLHGNRGKRSIVVDLDKPGGRTALLKLCEAADVFVHDSPRQAMQRLKLTHEDVAAVNPRIVHCSVLAFGKDGPYAAKPADDEALQGLAAIPMLQARLNEAAPAYLPFLFADRSCGLVLAQTLLAGLLARDRTGMGQAIELPMFETLAALVLAEHLWGRSFEPPLGEAGMERMFTRRPARTQDGYLCYTLAQDAHVASFCDIAGRPEMKQDPRFARRADRNRNITQFYRFVEQELAKRSTAEWVELFNRADLPAAAAQSLDQLMDDPHLHQVGFFNTVDHPTEGRLVTIRAPTRWSDTEPANARPAPLLGEHTLAVLREAGYAASDIEHLLTTGAVCAAPPSPKP